jgi:hypothetical protein
MLVVLAAMGACRSQPIATTSVEYIRQVSSSGEIAPCRSVTGGDPGKMDSYMVEVWEYNDTASGLADGGVLASSSNTIECQRCIAPNSGLCHLERQRICRCGPRMNVDPNQLGPSLAGLRVEGIDANYAYCLRAIAIDSGTISSSDPGPDADTDCNCDDEWSMALFLIDSARMCAMSERAAAGPVGFEMYITCPGDGVNFRFPNPNTPYQQCLFPTAN